MKLVASAAVSDDARLLSSLLSRQPDEAAASRLAELAQPLVDEERALRWLVQHEFAAGLSRFKSIPLTQGIGPKQQSEDNERWLSAMAGLTADTFERIEFPVPANAVLNALAKKQRTLNLYAAYYDDLVKAFGNTPIKLPTLRDTAKQGPRTVLDPFLNPINNMFASAPEPAWAPLAGYLRETDARLRLAGLQVALRLAQSPAQNQHRKMKDEQQASFLLIFPFPVPSAAALNLFHSLFEQGSRDVKTRCCFQALKRLGSENS